MGARDESNRFSRFAAGCDGYAAVMGSGGESTRMPVEPRVDVRAMFDIWSRRFADNNLLTYASAIALQLLVALGALIFLSVALLRPLGAEGTWFHTLAPALGSRIPVEWMVAVTWSVQREASSSGVGLIVFGAAVSIWEVSGAVRAVMGALNRIYGVEEPRGIRRRFAVSIGLAIVVSALLVLAALIGAGAFQPGLRIVAALGRVLVPAVLIYLVVAVLVLVAPAKRQPWRWVSAGSVGIVVVWLTVSAAFGYWMGSVANLHTPEGALALIVSTVGYLYASAIAFLVGAQVDQLVREGGASAVFGSGRH
jgi:membrane protein